jgi:hypothetical protein
MPPPPLLLASARAQGQPIRLLLTHAGVAFEDVRYTLQRTADGGCAPHLRMRSCGEARSTHSHALCTLPACVAARWHREKWLSVKHTLGLDFPNLPYFIDGDLKLTQSDAILLHVAKQARLMGATDEARALALMLLGVASDLRSPCVPPRGSRAPH